MSGKTTPWARRASSSRCGALRGESASHVLSRPPECGFSRPPLFVCRTNLSTRARVRPLTKGAVPRGQLDGGSGAPCAPLRLPGAGAWGGHGVAHGVDVECAWGGRESGARGGSVGGVVVWARVRSCLGSRGDRLLGRAPLRRRMHESRECTNHGGARPDIPGCEGDLDVARAAATGEARGSQG